MPATVQKPETTAHEAWIEKNPLRRWRKRSGATWAEVSSRLGVGITAIKYWEWGASRPTPENMQRIGEIIGAPGIEAMWTRWSNSRPRE